MHLKYLARQYSPHVGVDGVLPTDVLTQEISVYRSRTYASDRSCHRPQRLDSRTEQKPAVTEQIVQWFDAEPIACEDKPPLNTIPQRERKHAREAVESTRSAALVKR